MSGVLLAVGGAAGHSCQNGRREEEIRGMKDISRLELTRCMRVMPPWRAMSAKVVKMKEPRNKSAKYVSVILRVIIERVISVIMSKM